MSMVRYFLVAVILVSGVSSCTHDRKKETITNYLKYVWKIKNSEELTLTKVEEVKSITGKDSIEILVAEYSKGAPAVLPLDTILVNIEKDVTYNTNLLNKTIKRIDSLKLIKSSIPDNSFYTEYLKTFTDLRDFTTTQLVELKFQRYLLTKYLEGKDDVFCHQVLCQYEIRGHSLETTPRMVTQTFFLSPDTRKIYTVR